MNTTNMGRRWNHAVGMGSAPAPGAVGRALAAHSGRRECTRRLGRPGAAEFGAGRAERQPERLRSPSFQLYGSGLIPSRCLP